MKHKLIEIEWPQFGPPAVAPELPLAELERRVDETRRRMVDDGLTHLAVYADREHFANLAWLTNFDPRFEEALLIIGRNGPPLLVVGNECESYLKISPLWVADMLRSERYQPFSLLDQPREESRTLGAILKDEGITRGAVVGCVGWKYYGDPMLHDVPSYIVDELRTLAGPGNVRNATAMFQHAAYGLRAECSAWEIAYFEYTNWKASEAMKRVQFALRLGMTDHELLAQAGYDGLPLSCHMTLKTGPNRISLASPSGNVVERGYPISANIAYWGSNICRAGWVAESAADLPEKARDYVDNFAGPYFTAMAEWLSHLTIGRLGGELNDLIQSRLPFEKYGIFLNPGHLIHLEEWMSSPIFPGSEIPIRSGMVLQSDVIPGSTTYFSTRMEDGFAVAGSQLRDEIRTAHPACHARIQARREFLENVLGILLPEEVLPLSNMACLVSPYMLRPNLVFAVSQG